MEHACVLGCAIEILEGKEGLKNTVFGSPGKPGHRFHLILHSSPLSSQWKAIKGNSSPIENNDIVNTRDNKVEKKDIKQSIRLSFADKRLLNTARMKTKNCRVSIAILSDLAKPGYP